MTTGVRLLRGVFALAALALLMAGIPLALWHLGGPLLPDHLPGIDETAAALRNPADGRFVLGFLVVCGWLFWTHLVVSTAAEIGDQIRSRPRRRGRPFDGRGFRTSRALTGTLIVWLVTMFASPAASSAAVPATTTVSMSFEPTPAAAHLTDLDAGQSVGPEYTVAPRDSLWSIAEKTLGDPLRWRQIYDLNAGRTQSDGGRLDDRSLLHVGWVLRLPFDGAPPPALDGRIRIQPGDTLTRLAEEYLHDARRYPQLYETNVGRPQADGGVLQDPNQIRPGWLLTIPPNDDVASPTPAPSVPAPPAPTPITPPVPSSVPAAATPTVAPPSTTRAPAELPSAAPQPTVTPVPSDLDNSTALPAALAVSSVAAAAFVSGLALWRRRQLRFRGTRRHIALPDAIHAPAEAAAASSARSDDTHLLDLALRSVAAVCEPQDGYPDLTAAWLGSNDVDLLLADPYPPPLPFTAGDDNALWHVTCDDELPIDDRDMAGAANPFPAVAAFGTGDDGTTTLLLDLEHHGAVHVVGDDRAAQDLVRNVVIELALSSWADATQILVVGLESQLTDLPPGRISHFLDLSDALARLEAAREATHQHLDRLSTDSVVEARVHDQLSETWVVTVLVIADPAAIHGAALDALCRDLSTMSRTSTAVLTGGSSSDLPGLQVRVRSDGSVDVPEITDNPLQAVQMSAELALGLVSVIGTTFQPDVAIPASTDPSPWAVEMTIDGSLAPEDTPHTDDQIDDDLESDASLFALAPAADGEIATADPAESEAPASPLLERTLMRTERNDPDLDADLALWHAGEPPTRPLVAILGEPEMRAPGVRPARRVPWLLEVALYLALHPQGVDRDKISTDLWPEGRNIQPPTIRRAIADVRAWAGVDTSTDPPTDFIPAISSSGADRYRMLGHLCDWDLFRRLRKRAQARCAAGRRSDAIDDYVAALGLVRGPVLRPLRDRGYAWLRNPDQHHDSVVPAFIIDTAHELVDLALDGDDLPLARSAAETARLVDPDLTFDRPFTDLMRVAHAEGNLAEMREQADLLLAERGFEVGEDLPPESFAVFDALFPNGLRAPAS